MQDLSCPLRNNSPMADYEPSEPVGLIFDQWSEVSEEQALPETAIKQKYARLTGHDGSYLFVPVLSPYSPEWIRRWKGKLWSAIRLHGLPSKFVTLTYRDGTLSGSSLESAFAKEFEKFMKRLKRKYGKMHYLRVMEYGSAFGRLHYHIAFWDCPFIPKRELERIWGFGWVDIQIPHALRYLASKFEGYFDLPKEVRINLVNVFLDLPYENNPVRQAVTRLIGYLLKYLLKSSEYAENRPKGLRVVSASRGLIPNDFESPKDRFLENFEGNWLWNFMTAWRYHSSCLEYELPKVTPEQSLEAFLNDGTLLSIGSISYAGKAEPSSLPLSAKPVEPFQDGWWNGTIDTLRSLPSSSAGSQAWKRHRIRHSLL